MSNLIINQVTTKKLKTVSNYYKVSLDLFIMREQMMEGYHTNFITHQNIWLRCNDAQIAYKWWFRREGVSFLNENKLIKI